MIALHLKEGFQLLHSALLNGVIMVGIILVINIIYVTFLTLRMILTLKGQRYLAAFIGTIEMLVYVVGLGLVLDNLNQIQNVIAYAVGFGIGIIVGTKIEEKLALGYITVNAITKELDLDLPKQLRKKGYGVTHWVVGGLEGDRTAMQILTPRKYELQLYETIKSIDSKAFIISYEPKTIHGGFWVKAVKKRRIKE